MGNPDIFDTRILEKALDAASLRQQVIANNIANATIPGYNGMNVAFETELKEAVAGNDTGFKMVSTNTRPGHIQIEDSADLDSIQAKVIQESGPVDINKQMVNQAKNTIMYNAMVAKISKNFSMLKSVIQGMQ